MGFIATISEAFTVFSWGMLQDAFSKGNQKTPTAVLNYRIQHETHSKLRKNITRLSSTAKLDRETAKPRLKFSTATDRDRDRDDRDRDRDRDPTSGFSPFFLTLT